jgi:ABC-type sulfate transport system substrate-binding protein
LALQAAADCKDCAIGINLNDTPFTVSLFANTLLANCAQVSRTIYTATNMMAGRVAEYDDLWKLTIANYHAGPGCVSYAIHQAWQSIDDLSWAQVSTFFTEPCRGVVPYVEQITR